MSNQEIFDEFEYIMDRIEKIIKHVENTGDKTILKKSLELIDAVSWQYETERDTQ